MFADPKTGLFQIEWRENGQRLRRSLKHGDFARAKQQADEFAAGFVRPDTAGVVKPNRSRLLWSGFLKSTAKK